MGFIRERKHYLEAVVPVGNANIFSRQHPVASPKIFQSDAAARFCFRFGLDTVGYDQLVVRVRVNIDVEGRLPADEVVLHRVFHQGQHAQCRQVPQEQGRFGLDGEEKFPFVPDAQQVGVGLDELELFGQRDHLFLVTLQDVAEDVREFVEVGKCLFLLAVTYQGVQSAERIEEEVRVDLPHQGVIRGLPFLRLQLLVFQLHLLLAVQQADEQGAEQNGHQDEDVFRDLRVQEDGRYPPGGEYAEIDPRVVHHHFLRVGMDAKQFPKLRERGMKREVHADVQYQRVEDEQRCPGEERDAVGKQDGLVFPLPEQSVADAVKPAVGYEQEEGEQEKPYQGEIEEKLVDLYDVGDGYAFRSRKPETVVAHQHREIDEKTKQDGYRKADG